MTFLKAYNDSTFVKYAISVIISFTFLSIVTFGQDSNSTLSPASGRMTPFVTDLKGISIGMSSDEVLEKLGKPKVKDDAGMLFSLGKKEAVQIGIGTKGLVRTIALIYEDGNRNAPVFEDIFGSTVEKNENEDGSVYKMIRYDDDGFWLAYSQTAGDSTFTTLTMGRINR
ncbi:hypothetical protein BH10ACI3_BH10ACI3_02180 [soil metagenome]